MSSDPRVLIGVCTYNEASNIHSLVVRLRDALPDADIVVIDDDSPDGTASLVESISNGDARVQLIVRKEERGLGSAIVRAARKAVEDQYDYFLNLDADLSHDPAQLPLLLKVAVDDPDIDVVVGSRYAEGGKIVGWPLRRKIMSRTVNWFATFFLRLPVSDCSGSMRCYRVSVLNDIDLDTLKCRGYALLEELLVQLNHQECKMAEVPITFTERQDGESKLTIREAVRSVTYMLRLAFSTK